MKLTEHPYNGTVTCELPDGRCVDFDARAIRENGLAELLRYAGIEPPTERVDVMRRGKKIGTVPADFHPLAIKSKSPWYDVREGDFIRDGDVWIAGRTLGPGDLDAVPGFIRDED